MPITFRTYGHIMHHSYAYPNFHLPLTPELYGSLREYHSSVIQVRLRKLSLLRSVRQDLLFIAELNAHRISNQLLAELFQAIEAGWFSLYT
jgi:hypothetical protein